MECITLETLNKHLFIGSDGSAVFVFKPEEAFIANPEGEGFVINPGLDVLDFMAVLDTLSLEPTEDNALALGTVLLERRADGDEDLLKLA